MARAASQILMSGSSDMACSFLYERRKIGALLLGASLSMAMTNLRGGVRTYPYTFREGSVHFARVLIFR